MRNALIVGIVVAASAGVHGAVTQRWEAFAPDAARTERMHAFAVKYADCEAVEVPHDVPLKERSTATSRRYTSESLGLGAMVSMISGVPGAVATHTPDVCYSGNGYVCLRGPLRESIDLPGGGTATYQVADFERKRESSAERLRIRWAWTADGRWDAPDYARFRYMKVPELFKIYIVTPLSDGDSPAADADAVRAFVAATFAQSAAAVNR